MSEGKSESAGQSLAMAMMRWVAVPPAAIAGFFAAGFLGYLISYVGSFLGGFGLDGNDPRHLIIGGGFAAFAGVYCAARVAPESRERLAAMLIAGLFILIALASLPFNILELRWTLIFQNLVVIIGAIGGVRYISGDLSL